MNSSPGGTDACGVVDQADAPASGSCVVATEPLPKEDQIIEALWANATIKAKVIHIDTPPDYTGWVIARELE